MSLFSTRCPQCGQKRNFRAESAETLVRCQACGHKFILPKLPSPVLVLAAVGAGLLSLCCVGVILPTRTTPTAPAPTVDTRVQNAKPAVGYDQRASAAELERKAAEEWRLAREAEAEGVKKKADEQAAIAGAKAEADRRDRKARDAEKLAAAKREAERVAEAMAEYELAKAEYHATTRIRAIRALAEDAWLAKAQQKKVEAERLEGRVKLRCEELLTMYPDSEAAEDARQILAGKKVPERKLPPLPEPPAGVKLAHDGEHRQSPTGAAAGPASPSSSASGQDSSSPTASRSKTVNVRGYTRKDGTQVQPHTRSMPGGRR